MGEDFKTIKWLRIILLIVWPIGGILVIGLLMVYCRVPQLAKRKVKRAKFQAFLKFAEANANRMGIRFDTSRLTNATVPEQLTDVPAATSTRSGRTVRKKSRE